MLNFLQSLNFTYIAILSALFGSVAALLARVLLKEIKTRDILGINFFSMAALMLLFSPSFYYLNFSWKMFGILILISAIDAGANYFYFRTFENTEASIAAPMLSLAPAFTFFFGWLILQESVSWHSFLLAFLIIVAVIIFSVDFKDFKNFSSQTLLPALISSFLFGLSAVPTKYLLVNMHAINAPTLYMFRAGFVAFFVLLFLGFNIKELSVKQYRWIFVRSLFVIAQWVFLYYALAQGSTGVSVTIANITPIFVFILGIFFLREKFSWKKVLAAISILILSFII